MGYLRLSFTERRRASLARKFDQLCRLENRNTITEPISVTGLSISALRGLAQLGIMSVAGGNNSIRLAASSAAARNATGRGHVAGTGPTAAPLLSQFTPMNLDKPRPGGAGGGVTNTGEPYGARRIPSKDWLDVSKPDTDSTDPAGISTPWRPAPRTGGGGALPPRGSGSTSGQTAPRHGLITPLRIPAPAPSAGGGAATGGAAGRTEQCVGQSWRCGLIAIALFRVR